MGVGKTRKTNKHLPRRMYMKYGAYYFVNSVNQWIRLGDDYTASLKVYATLIDTSTAGTIASCVQKYCDEILPKRAEETQKGRRKEFKNILKVFGPTKAVDLRASHAWKYFTKRGENQAARHEVSALSAVMGWAVKWGIIDRNPLLDMQIPGFKPRDRYVTDDEFVSVRDCVNQMIGFAMDIALMTAARQRQIRLLDKKIIAAGKLQVTQSKGGKKLNYAFAGSLEETIQNALAVGPQVRQYVIVNREGLPYTLGGFQTQWKRGIKKALKLGLITTPFTFHDIRAKSLSDAESLEAAQKRAGHADPRITAKVYRRLPETVSVQDISHLVSKKK